MSTIPWSRRDRLPLTPDHSLLLAMNAVSGTVSVFRVHGTDLNLLDQVPSGGSQPVAVAELGSLVYVLNSGGAGSVVGFQLNDGGHLKQIANSTAFLSGNATGGASISLSPDGRFLIVTERLANNIDVFPVHQDGTLGPIVANPSPGPGAFSVNFAPDGKAIVSETGAADTTNGSAVFLLHNSRQRYSRGSQPKRCYIWRGKLLECCHSERQVCLCLQRGVFHDLRLCDHFNRRADTDWIDRDRFQPGWQHESGYCSKYRRTEPVHAQLRLWQHRCLCN